MAHGKETEAEHAQKRKDGARQRTSKADGDPRPQRREGRSGAKRLAEGGEKTRGRYGGNAFGFNDLKVYQTARAFRNSIYELSKTLPADEKYDLARQMRRAAVSITNNMAEGYGRYTWQDTTHFFRQARGSLAEVLDDISVCEDQGMSEPEQLDALREKAVQLLQLINGYIRYLQGRKRTEDDSHRE